MRMLNWTQIGIGQEVVDWPAFFAFEGSVRSKWLFALSGKIFADGCDEQHSGLLALMVLHKVKSH